MKRTVQMKNGGGPKAPRIELKTLREWLVAASSTAGREVDLAPSLQPRDAPYLDEPKSKLKLDY